MKRFLILCNVNIFWYQVCNFLLIWLWFKVENICDISILMYQLPHCLLERFHSLVVKNPNTLFTTFTCLLLGQNESSFAFGLRSPKPIHVSYFTCRKKSRATFWFLFTIGRQFLLMHHYHLCNRFSKNFRWFFSTLSIKTDIHVVEP